MKAKRKRGWTYLGQVGPYVFSDHTSRIYRRGEQVLVEFENVAGVTQNVLWTIDQVFESGRGEDWRDIQKLVKNNGWFRLQRRVRSYREKIAEIGE